MTANMRQYLALMTANMRQYLAFKPQIGNDGTIFPRLRRSLWGSEFDKFRPKFRQGGCDFDFIGGVKICTDKLFSFAQG